LDDQGLLGECDIVAIAGAVKEWGHALKQIEVSKRLHNISNIILINHTDCGAYGGDDSRHEHDLKAAKNDIVKKYPDISVKTILAKIAENAEISFQNIDS